MPPFVDEPERGGDHDAVPDRVEHRSDEVLVGERPVDPGDVEGGHALVTTAEEWHRLGPRQQKAPLREVGPDLHLSPC